MDLFSKIDFKKQINLDLLSSVFAGGQLAGYVVKLSILFVVVIVFMLVTNSVASKKERRVESKLSELNEFYALRDSYILDRASIEDKSRKLMVRVSAGSTGAIIEEIGTSLGMKEKITSFKPLEESSPDGYVAGGVQVEIEGITLNQLVNLLYKTEKYQNLLLIKDFSMRSHFQNPDLVDVTMQVILVTKRS